MRARMGSFKVLLTIIFLFMGLTLLDSLVYAVDEAELKSEAEKAYQELRATDPEAAQEFIREYREAVKSGEITLEKADTESGKEIGERGVGEGERRYSEADSRKMENEFNTLLKEGKTPQEAEKMMREKYSEGAGPRPPEGMERYGPEGGREFEMSKEEMAEHFREEMGREPNEFEKEMMERGEFERPEFDRPEFERPEFERPEFERPEIEREWAGDRYDKYQPPPPMPPVP